MTISNINSLQAVTKTMQGVGQTPISGYPVNNNALFPNHSLFGFASDSQNIITPAITNTNYLAGTNPGGMGLNTPMPVPGFPGNKNTMTPEHGIFSVVSNLQGLLNKYTGGLYGILQAKMNEGFLA